ncbi:MAG: oxaloacetate decarboxylase subunit alpha [Bacillota bacterium]
MAKVGITDTILRDAHQSQAATRMTTKQMEPAFERLDKVGYFSLECWGGATFDTCLRFLNEDPWERLRAMRKGMPSTKLQMLLRGQNILGYKHYADDVVDFFVKKTLENGIDIIRCFDALNDLRNMETAVKATKKYKGIAEVAMCYTTSPVHTEDYFVKLSAQIAEMGADLICIKDMANLLLPYAAYSLIKRLKAETSLPIVLHTHDTTGTGAMTLLKAVEAGADVLDTALSPLGGGTAQPSTEALVATLQGSEFDTGLDLKKLVDLAAYFRGVADELTKAGFRDPARVLATDVNTLLYQVPGGMLSNLISQMKQANAMDKYYAVLEEIPRVRKDFGYPPLVTPTSQIVGTQAMMNVLAGEPYKMNPKESQALMRGEYGRLPAPVNEKVRKKVIGDTEVITHRPADDIPPELDKYRKEIREYYQQEEDVLSYALFPQVAIKYFQYRQARQLQVDSTMLDKEAKVMPV